MGESIFDKMASEAASKWMQPRSEPVPVKDRRQLSVRPEYRVGGKYRGRL